MSGPIWFIIRWTLKLLPLLVLAALLHFYLPGHEVVRIVGTEVNRVDRESKAADPSSLGTVTRDVRFINTVNSDGDPKVFRNEDTGWGFPWYFKFDSGNLQAVAQDRISTSANPIWVEITHYGWRIEMLSMFPNAVDIEPVEGPDATVIPWFTIVFLIVLAILLLLIRRTWIHFMARLALDERFENASNSLYQIGRWLKANLRDLGRLIGFK